MSGPLSGVKILELATMVAAPSCARILSDMGAEVIKVEHPKGDGWRRTAISYHADRYSEDESPVFDIYNSGKKHIAINLKTPDGMAAFHKLLAQSDVFITNTRPAALKRLGIYYDDLKEQYPGKAIVLNIELLDPDAENYDDRVRRLRFYEKNGFHDTGYNIDEVGGTFRILSTAKEFDPDAYLAVFKWLSFGVWRPRITKV